MRIRLDRADDLLHPVEAATNFNESRYYNFYDPGPGLGGWVRMGNRPNEGYAEMTVCLYLPDGRVGFTFKRPKIDGHTAHDAGGLRFEVVEPFVEHLVTYDGRVLLLDVPRQMVDPRQAFADNPLVPCTIALTHRAVGRPWGGEPERDEGEAPIEVDPETSFAHGHTEQHMAVTGTVTVGDDEFVLTDGLGLRDHSWGPRYWQSIWWYRWLTGNLGPDLGFAVTVTGRPDGRVREPWLPVRPRPLRRRPVGAGPRRGPAHGLRRRGLPPGGAGRVDDRRPPLRGARRRVVEHPVAQPPPDPGRRAVDDAHRRGHDHVALRRRRRRRPRRVPGPDRRRCRGGDRRRVLTSFSYRFWPVPSHRVVGDVVRIVEQGPGLRVLLDVDVAVALLDPRVLQAGLVERGLVGLGRGVDDLVGVGERFLLRQSSRTSSSSLISSS